jgi:para-nitrobenzyl esterase
MRRHFDLSIACFLVCVFARAGLAAADVPVPTVTLKAGIVEGVHFGPRQTGVAFLGVPYAAPPVGDLRWKPPQPVRPWTGMRSATKFGAACPQLPAGWLPYIGWNEDCLHLNVWTTHLYVGPKLPVIVYFHGGSNTTGYSQIGPAWTHVFASGCGRGQRQLSPRSDGILRPSSAYGGVATSLFRKLWSA